MVSALYIHIPFCTAKCNYCSFNSYAGLDALQERYVDALCVELEKVSTGPYVGTLQTIFLGGGTPTVLSAHFLQRILDSYFSFFSIAPDAEISIEANPGTVDVSLLTLLQKSGVNRISFGVQSFTDSELKKIGRIHSSAEAKKAVDMAKDAGIGNISIDLMYGLPGQTAKSWQRSLDTAISLSINHLSLYQLTVEGKTPLANMLHKGSLQLPDEGTIMTLDTITMQRTAAAGFSQYEISNYAQHGYQCRHNITYWDNLEYAGVGAGAVSCVQGRRTRNIENPEQYCVRLEHGEPVTIEEEILDSDASFRETVIMGLRMNRGISVDALRKRYGLILEDYYGEVFDRLLTDGLLEKTAGYYYLTAKGRMFANRVMAELV